MAKRSTRSSPNKASTRSDGKARTPRRGDKLKQRRTLQDEETSENEEKHSDLESAVPPTPKPTTKAVSGNNISSVVSSWYCHLVNSSLL
jgi:hypothetical protein